MQKNLFEKMRDRRRKRLINVWMEAQKSQLAMVSGNIATLTALSMQTLAVVRGVALELEAERAKRAKRVSP